MNLLNLFFEKYLKPPKLGGLSRVGAILFRIFAGSKNYILPC